MRVQFFSDKIEMAKAISLSSRKRMYTRCSLCGEAEHTMMKCPDLTDPLRPGFSGAGGGGGGGHGGDDDSLVADGHQALSSATIAASGYGDDDETLVQVPGNKFGLWYSDQRSGYTTLSSPPSMAAHQLNELLEMTAPAPQLLITWSAMSSLGSSQKMTSPL